MLSFKDIFSCVPLKVERRVVDLGKPREIVRRVRGSSARRFSQAVLDAKLDVKAKLDRKLFRRLEIQRRIDLHGLTLDAAFLTLGEFFQECQREGIKIVIVITGGNAMKHSPIRSSFKKWVKDNFSNFVVSYTQAKLNDGGQGAFYVIIRRKKM